MYKIVIMYIVCKYNACHERKKKILRNNRDLQVNLRLFICSSSSMYVSDERCSNEKKIINP